MKKNMAKTKLAYFCILTKIQEKLCYVKIILCAISMPLAQNFTLPDEERVLRDSKGKTNRILEFIFSGFVSKCHVLFQRRKAKPLE